LLTPSASVESRVEKRAKREREERKANGGGALQQNFSYLLGSRGRKKEIRKRGEKEKGRPVTTTRDPDREPGD
jgi:hypothetical protein